MPSIVKRHGEDPDNPYRSGQTDEQGNPICGSKKRKSDEKCMRNPVVGGTRCKLHGGLSLSGAEHPKFVDGRYSKHLPDELLDTYLVGLDDPKLRECGDEIALLDVRIKQLTERVEEGDNDLWWREVDKLWNKFMFSVRTGNQNEQNRLLVELNETITNGRDENQAWREITLLVDQRRKLVETEQRRLVQAQQMITVEQAMLMMSATIASLRDVVYLYAEPHQAKTILLHAQREYNKLIGFKSIDGTNNRTLDG